ncbi:MAG: hypothetical protein KQH83_03650 [Actinobacteria bacterium]|nr:hypothetical protein [Actinomycetota bacterium]
MTSFTLTPVEKGIMRCRHTGTLSSEDVQMLAHFLHDYRGKLLIDLTGTTGEECARHIAHFRPMMPTAAVFGADLDPSEIDIPESYYTHPVKFAATEDEALAWLREQ